MEKSIYINSRTINNSQPNRFALERVLFEGNAAYEYFVDNEWRPGPPQSKPEGKRIVFNDVDTFRAARDTYFAWSATDNMKAYHPVYPNTVIRRMYESRLSGIPLPLFIPWGFRTTGEPNKEFFVLDRILQFTDTLLRPRGIRSEVIIMPADLYATEINGIDPNLVNTYFEFVASEARLRGFKVAPWSKIREENQAQYRRRTDQLSNKTIQELLPNPVIDKAIEAAEKRVIARSTRLAEQSAFSYLRERMCEAEIVEEKYRPIKVSVVAINKDNGVDGNLPRLYIIPLEEQFPWIDL